MEPPAGTMVAAFDTHADHPRLVRHIGSAAGGISRRLDRLGVESVADPEHFWVAGLQGPLQDGELDRAREFGEAVAAEAARQRRIKAARTPTAASSAYS